MHEQPVWYSSYLIQKNQLGAKYCGLFACNIYGFLKIDGGKCTIVEIRNFKIWTQSPGDILGIAEISLLVRVAVRKTNLSICPCCLSSSSHSPSNEIWNQGNVYTSISTIVQSVCGTVVKPLFLVVKQLLFYQLHKTFLSIDVSPLVSSLAVDK